MAIMLNSLLAGLVLVGLFQIVKRVARRSQATSNGCRPPRTRPSWDLLFGIDLFINDMKLRNTNKLLPREASLFKQLGTHTFKSTSLSGTVFMTGHPENIKMVMSTKTGEWGVGPIRNAAMGAFCGDGFLTTDGPVWQHSRAMLQPSFAKQNVSNLSAFSGMVDQLMAKIPKNGTMFDLQPMIMAIFIDLSQHFLIGQAPGVFSSQGAVDAPLSPNSYLDAFSSSLIGMGLRMVTGSFRSLVPKSLTTAHWEKIWTYIDFYIARNLEKRGDLDERRPQSLLESVASQTSDCLEIRNQVLQGTLAAQDTTPSLISNTVSLLVRYPHVWQSLRQEFSKLGATPSADALRVGGGDDGKSPIFVPRGCEILCQFYALHRNPEVFGGDVENFNPDRWAKISPSSWEYMPFGGGQRACLGQNKALNEACYVIWRLAQEVEVLRSCDDEEYAGRYRLIAINANGCKISCA